MGSVIDDKKCEACDGVAFNDFYYRTGEEFSTCKRCGYSSSYCMKHNESGDVVLENNLPVFVHKVSPGFGVFHITHRSTPVSQSGSFNKPINETTIEEFKKIFAQHDIDPKNSYLAKWEDGKQTFILGETDNLAVMLSYDEVSAMYEEKSKKD